jgi:hypothetical protein
MLSCHSHPALATQEPAGQVSPLLATAPVVGKLQHGFVLFLVVSFLQKAKWLPECCLPSQKTLIGSVSISEERKTSKHMIPSLWATCSSWTLSLADWKLPL